MPETLTHDTLDTLVKEKFVSFRANVIKGFSGKHPYMFSFLQSVFSDRLSKVGLQVVEQGQVARDYTINLKGIHISEVESGTLSSDIKHPVIGTIRPYLVLERSTLERIIADEASFVDDIFAVIPKYLPELTIKFLR